MYRLHIHIVPIKRNVGDWKPREAHRFPTLGVISPIIRSASKSFSRHFIFHQKCVFLVIFVIRVPSKPAIDCFLVSKTKLHSAWLFLLVIFLWWLFWVIKIISFPDVNKKQECLTATLITAMNAAPFSGRLVVWLTNRTFINSHLLCKQGVLYFSYKKYAVFREVFSYFVRFLVKQIGLNSEKCVGYCKWWRSDR